MTIWMNGNTAPHDGTSFLGYVNGRFEVIYWSEEHGAYYADGEDGPSDDEDWYGIGRYCVTHWMPLPNRP